VLQVEPPKDPETYIHRSGRTGRAGHTGVCITLVGRKHEDRVPFIERKAGEVDDDSLLMHCDQQPQAAWLQGWVAGCYCVPCYLVLCHVVNVLLL
jgi:superfamily II DNA/RNA helicase